MSDFFVDLFLIALLVVGGTAFLGTISRGIVRIFSGKNNDESWRMVQATKEGWKKIGGKQQS